MRSAKRVRLLLALLPGTPMGAVEVPKCEEAVKVWSDYWVGTLHDDDREWRSCVIEKMELLGFRFRNDFVNVSADKFVCY